MDKIKQAGTIFLKIIGVVAIFALLIGSLSRIQPDGDVQPLNVFFAGVNDDADCTILLNRNRCVIIDTGEEQDVDHILAMLRELAVTKIDCMILTHPDKDHVGGASAILDEMKVDLVIAPYYIQEKERYTMLLEKISSMGIDFLTPSRNREFYYGDLRLRIFPPDDVMYEKVNDYSLITLVEHGDVRMLFMGDAEKKRIQEAEIYQLRDIDLYKVPHHGRESKSGAEFIEKIHPQFAVVTAKSTSEEIEAALERSGTQFYYTVPQYDILFESDGKELTLIPEAAVSGIGGAEGL